MTTPVGAHPAEELHIDWRKAEQFLRARLRGQVDHLQPADVNDLVQEALVRLLRAVRREPARELEALMHVIARRTAVDLIRRRQRWRLVFQQSDETSREAAAPTRDVLADAADPVDRVRFVVLEFFRSHKASCCELALAYFQTKQWNTVAAELGKTPLAIRRRWSRCVDLLRKQAAEDPSFALLVGWTREQV